MNLKTKLKNLLSTELSTKQKRRIPAWIIALVAIVVIAAFVIFWAPRIFHARLKPEIRQEERRRGALIYTENTAVVRVPQTAVYPLADNTRERLCSLIFNEPVEVLDKSLGKYWLVKLPEGLEGYVASVDLDTDTEAIEPELAYYKAVVLAREKRLYSHARRGELKAVVPLGTVLFADYRSQELLRVKLAGGDNAWVSTEDLLILEPDQKITVPEAEQVSRFLSSLMAFYGAPRLPAQMTINGTDMAGAVSIAARLNGLELPRTIEAQARVGERVELARDQESGLVNLNDLKAGDLIYFAHPESPDKVFDLACVMEDSLVLMNQVNSSTIGIWDLANDEERHKQIAFVIRHFPLKEE
ncbi:MAG: hypothetical protein Q4P08_02165 [Eubacteriales bacterium]|nr:hypothetical protein [Eubacteriales bacterium]